MSIVEIFKGKNKNLNKKSYFWIMAGSASYAGVSVLLLILVTRLLGTQQAGIFSFGYSNAQMFLTIGLFETRGFHSTDLIQKYKFEHYLSSRLLTCFFMLLVSVLFVFINGYIFEKSLIIFLLTVLKMFDAVSDVFEGLYQQNERIDLSGKTVFLKMCSLLITFSAILFISRNLVYSVVASCVILGLFVLLIDKKVAGTFSVVKISREKGEIIHLIKDCFPLFISSFLLLLIYNLPKYAIDIYFSAEYQTYYSIMFMPAMVINLLRGFTFKPVMTKLMRFWIDKNLIEFANIMKKQAVYLMLVSAGAFIGGYLFGLPFLNLLYNVELNEYRAEFMILICGGCINALVITLASMAVIMRKQLLFLWAYVITIVLSIVLSLILPLYMGFMGIALSFLLSMLILVLIFSILIFLQLKKTGFNFCCFKKRKGDKK